MAPFDRTQYDFLLIGHCKYSSVLYHFRDKARFWSKFAIFHTSCIRRPRWGGGSLSEYFHII